MNGRLLLRGIAIGLTALALAGCATTAAPPQEMSILDAMSARGAGQPMSCAAMNAATMCVKASRLDRSKRCECVDRMAVTDGKAFDF